MNMNKGSMIETAIKILNEKGTSMKFADLWAGVKEALEITPEEEASRIGHFYTDLSLSGDTIVLGDNVWDLRERHTYEQKHIDVSDIYSDVDEKDDDEADAQEDKEYDDSVNGVVSSSKDDDDSTSAEEDSDEEKARHARQEAAELIGEDR